MLILKFITAYSQILEVLLEFNDSLQVSPSLRYDLNVPGDPLFPQEAETGDIPVVNDTGTANSVMKQAQSELRSGVISLEHYYEVENAVRHGEACAPDLQYTALSKASHTQTKPEDRPQSADGELADNLGYLTPEHETEYYLAVDAKLGDESAATRISRAPEKPTFSDRERELATRRPYSVYNWLRKHQPQTSVQENEGASEKSNPRPAHLRSSKRVSGQGQSRKNEDIYDEEGNPIDLGPPPTNSKSKRKRDDDTSYRPKGGSNRPSRKKKDDSSNLKRSSKK